jgi:hypothetical protein
MQYKRGEQRDDIWLPSIGSPSFKKNRKSHLKVPKKSERKSGSS